MPRASSPSTSPTGTRSPGPTPGTFAAGFAGSPTSPAPRRWWPTTTGRSSATLSAGGGRTLPPWVVLWTSRCSTCTGSTTAAGRGGPSPSGCSPTRTPSAPHTRRSGRTTTPGASTRAWAWPARRSSRWSGSTSPAGPHPGPVLTRPFAWRTLPSPPGACSGRSACSTPISTGTCSCARRRAPREERPRGSVGPSSTASEVSGRGRRPPTSSSSKHWVDPAVQCELFLWSPRPTRERLRGALTLARAEGLTDVTALALEPVAGLLRELGGEVRSREEIFATRRG